MFILSTKLVRWFNRLTRKNRISINTVNNILYVLKQIQSPLHCIHSKYQPHSIFDHQLTYFIIKISTSQVLNKVLGKFPPRKLPPWWFPPGNSHLENSHLRKSPPSITPTWTIPTWKILTQDNSHLENFLSGKFPLN